MTSRGISYLFLWWLGWNLFYIAHCSCYSWDPWSDMVHVGPPRPNRPSWRSPSYCTLLTAHLSHRWSRVSYPATDI